MTNGAGQASVTGKPRFTKRVKELIVCLTANPLSALLRQTSFPRLRRLVWIKFFKPSVMWRNISFPAKSNFGSQFICRVSDTVQGRIFSFGVWEPNLTHFIQRRLRTGDTFIDVGANIGYFSMLASKLVGPAGKVIAIEASPSIFSLLQRNIELNAAKNVTVVNSAAAASRGVLSIYRGPNENIGHTSTLASAELSLEAEVPSDRLSALAGDDLLRARFIKIDVEGAEAPVLQDILSVSDALLSELEIAVELSPSDLSSFGVTAEGLLKQFHDAGFHPYILENSYSDEAYLQSEKHIPPRRLVGTPTEMVDLIFSRIDATEL